MKKNLNKIIIFSFLTLVPSFAHACGLGMISISNGELMFILGVLVAIFLAGYLPYVILSTKLSKQSTTAEGASMPVKVWASIFAIINTSVFLMGLAVVLEIHPFIVFADVLLWGIPMFFYIKGMITRPPSQPDTLDA